MKQLAKVILELKKNPVKKIINKRVKEFKKLNKHPEKWFSELSYCILTAGSTAERCLLVQEKVGNGFKNLPLNKLKQKMKNHSCRFYNKRAGYIVEAREKFNAEKVKIIADKNLHEARLWLGKNIKGIGMKEASHFLRNVGYNLAIIDFHILDLLKKHNIVGKNAKPQKNYETIEEKLKELAKSTKLNLAALDLYLWYMETGKVLK